MRGRVRLVQSPKDASATADPRRRTIRAQPNPAEPEPTRGAGAPDPRSGRPRPRFFAGARGLEPGVFATLRKISRRRDYS
jgi:hypothetical protein